MKCVTVPISLSCACVDRGKMQRDRKNFQFYLEFEITGITFTPKRSVSDNKETSNGKKRKQTETVEASGGNFRLLE